MSNATRGQRDDAGRTTRKKARDSRSQKKNKQDVGAATLASPPRKPAHTRFRPQSGRHWNPDSRPRSCFQVRREGEAAPHAPPPAILGFPRANGWVARRRVCPSLCSKSISMCSLRTIRWCGVSRSFRKGQETRSVAAPAHADACVELLPLLPRRLRRCRCQRRTLGARVAKSRPLWGRGGVEKQAVARGGERTGGRFFFFHIITPTQNPFPPPHHLHHG